MTGTQARRVFIVEDEALVSLVLERLLVRIGYEIAGSASRLEEAIQKVQEETFDIAILDVNLAGKSSYPLAEILYGLKTPFIFVTGYGKGGLPHPWTDQVVLAKPYSQSQLVDAMQQAIAAGR